MATLPKLKKLQIINFSMNNLSINPNWILDAYSLELLLDNRDEIKKRGLYFFINDCIQSTEITAHHSLFKQNRIEKEGYSQFIFI
jgi:hypothetical protein